MVEVIIAGDLVPTTSNYELFCRGDAKALLGDELLTVFRKANVRIFNLEVPLADKATPIPKSGISLIAPTQTIAGIRAFEPTLISLANNHIMDQGAEGLTSTINIIEKNGLKHIGAGNDLDIAQKPQLIKADDITIGFFSCADREFNCADDTNPGANPFDVIDTMEQIALLKEQCDFLIVLFHAGKEEYRYPSPGLMKTCHKIANKGADVVVTQHSHCIGCAEKFEHSTIVYGQGNFLFDYKNNEYWSNSVIIRVNLIRGKEAEVSYIPLLREENHVRIANAQEANEIMEHFNARSLEILDKRNVQSRYIKFVDDVSDYYKTIMLGAIRYNLIFRLFNRLTRGKFANCVASRMICGKAKLDILNIIQCDAHREAVICMLQNEIASSTAQNHTYHN